MLCGCGCGEVTAVSSYTARRFGRVAGVPAPFVRGHAQALRVEDSYVVVASGCWLWTRKVTHKGYGIVERGAGRVRAMAAHRWVWVRLRGPLADGVQLHHVCENKLCVNPAHLEPVASSAEHRARHVSWGRPRGA